MYKKTLITALAVVATTLTPTGSAQAATPLIGSKCAAVQVGKIVKTSKGDLKCIKKSAKRFVWAKVSSTTPTIPPTPNPVEVSVPASTNSAIDTSWFPSTVKVVSPGNLKNIPIPATHATGGTLVEKTSQRDPSVDRVNLAWRQETKAVSGAYISNDLYSVPGKPFLAQANIYTWNVEKGNRARFAWAGPWDRRAASRYSFPSPSRLHMYFILIYPEETVLYYFPSFISATENVEDYAVARFPNNYPIISNLTSLEEASAKSKELAGNVEKLMKLMMDKTPAQNYAIKYTGHGSGRGGLFETGVWRGDARRMLQNLVAYNSGKKLAFYDAGTNCDESSLSMLDDLSPYFDYLLASQFERGGDPSCRSSDQPCWYQIDNPSTLISYNPFFFADNLTFGQSLALEAKLFQNSWYAIDMHQSLTVVDSARYILFRRALNNAIGQKPIAPGDLASFAPSSPFSASQAIAYNSYDVGKLIANKFPELMTLWRDALLLHVTSAPFKATAWEASGIYFHDFDVAALGPGRKYDADLGD